MATFRRSKKACANLSRLEMVSKPPPAPPSQGGENAAATFLLVSKMKKTKELRLHSPLLAKEGPGEVLKPLLKLV